MAQTMTPSNKFMTDGQIDKAVGHYRDMLTKHRDEIGSSDTVQKVLGNDQYLGEQVGVLRKHVGLITGMLTRRVKVNRTRSHQRALNATGRKQYVDTKVVNRLPVGKGKEVVIMHYFKPRPEAFDENGWMSPEKLAQEYDFFGVDPDLEAQTADNEADPAFADGTPNACQWRDKDGNLCYAAFDRWRGVFVFPDGDGDSWRDGWVFGGVPRK